MKAITSVLRFDDVVENVHNDKEYDGDDVCLFLVRDQMMFAIIKRTKKLADFEWGSTSLWTLERLIHAFLLHVEIKLFICLKKGV